MAKSLCTTKSPRLKDERGNIYGLLTVVEEAASKTHGAHWLCKCECGNTTIAAGSHLRQGRVASCGCRRREHGHAVHGQRSVEYQAWCAMVARCECKTHQNYKNYGGRGISVCREWRESYETFFASLGTRPTPGRSLDRINNDGNYEPGNVRWATKVQQNRNRRVTVKYEFNGMVLSLAEWESIVGIKARVIYSRIHDYGWSVEKALTAPCTKGL